MLIRLPGRPTQEQMVLITRTVPGVDVIRGAAGSGKTTTAILRLRQLASYFAAVNGGGANSVRLLVLAYNRSLVGYLEHACRAEVQDFGDIVDLTVDTFAHWSMNLLGIDPQRLDQSALTAAAARLVNQYGHDHRFWLNELQYVLGRFHTDQRQTYIEAPRNGRGNTPLVNRTMREGLLRELAAAEAAKNNTVWWGDLAIRLLSLPVEDKYDAIVIDEAQDLSANAMRAILQYAKDPAFITMVLDSAQRIYSHRYSWSELGLTQANSRLRFNRLRTNHRNTHEIAAFAAPLLNGIPIDDDATPPDPSSVTEHGPLPKVLIGHFSAQAQFAANFIQRNVDLERETVAFLHPLGGRWFNRDANSLVPFLRRQGLELTLFQGERDWTDGDSNIAVGTLHSAKGLEFDYVFFLGFDTDTVPHAADDPNDDRAQELRRLVAMAIGRARKQVIFGCRPEARPRILDLLDPQTYEVAAL
ncbi:AAA domain-containing protein [Azospirillum baldaniorum]|uniref:3'-5' exonuclease n=1 Tax=Azospirillum baldaniorum TaxID=1064539 RepID=UPI0011AD0BF8|nr:3'-5' exonuclease [Azospirillum baldaniorum]TWA69752.1 AAA domain-containing protein [Azospirillum baldaniorum]